MNSYSIKRVNLHTGFILIIDRIAVQKVSNLTFAFRLESRKSITLNRVSQVLTHALNRSLEIKEIYKPMPSQLSGKNLHN
jgi:hypothetical protein